MADRGGADCHRGCMFAQHPPPRQSAVAQQQPNTTAPANASAPNPKPSAPPTRWIAYRIVASVSWGPGQVVSAETVRLGKRGVSRRGCGHDRAHRCSGFTLVEVIAAFAIASVIIVATAALLNEVSRCPSTAAPTAWPAGERLAIAAERLGDRHRVGRLRPCRRHRLASPPHLPERRPASSSSAFEGADAGPRLDRRPSAAQEVVSLTLEAAG